MKPRTLTTWAAILFLVLSITGPILSKQAPAASWPRTPSAQPSLETEVWTDLQLVSNVCHRWQAGAVWGAASIGILCWHLLGERPAADRHHGNNQGGGNK